MVSGLLAKRSFRQGNFDEVSHFELVCRCVVQETESDYKANAVVCERAALDGCRRACTDSPRRGIYAKPDSVETECVSVPLEIGLESSSSHLELPKFLKQPV